MLSMICMAPIFWEIGLPARLPKERLMVGTRTDGEVEEVVEVDAGQGLEAVIGEGEEEVVEEMVIALCGLTSMDLQLVLTTELLWKI